MSAYYDCAQYYMTTPTSKFDASPSMLGYLFQVRYALLLSLRNIQSDDPYKHFVSIEKLDDIAFEKEGTPTELLQTKYHGAPGNLTDRSPDIWKTIRVWSEQIRSGAVDPTKAQFILVTTQDIPATGLAINLTINAVRNVTEIRETLTKIALETSNQNNLPGYKAFSQLSDIQKEQLIKAINIINNSPSISEVETLLKNDIRGRTNEGNVISFCSRLEGLWFGRVIEALSKPTSQLICLQEVVEMLDEIRAQFSTANLPADFTSAIPSGIETSGIERDFVKQLRLLDPHEHLIYSAKLNYYRAIEQTSRWSRESLLLPGELNTYYQTLHDEWLEGSGILLSGVDTSDESICKKAGLALLERCLSANRPIRSGFIQSYVTKGSYHKLADDLRIGWHPNFDSFFPKKSKDDE